MILAINSKNPQLRLIRRVVETLEKGGVIVYPTDTIYGLGCDLFNPDSIRKIHRLKKLDAKKPLSFICSDLKDISRYAYVSDYAYKAMKRLLPGAYTFILKATKMVPKIALTKQNTVGIRIPDNRICLALTKELGTSHHQHQCEQARRGALRPILRTSTNVTESSWTSWSMAV